MPSRHAQLIERFWGTPVPGHLKHGPTTRASRVYGCDCKACLPSGIRHAAKGQGKSATERQRESRARLRGQPVPPGVKHGVYAYHVYGCRCLECRTARAEQDELIRERWREAARGHWETRGDYDVIHWLPRDTELPWLCPDCDTKIFEGDS